MNTLSTGLLVAVALLASTAHAQDLVVIKDTRQYVPLTSSVSGPLGCTMPKDVARPNLDDPNECRITRSKLTAAGELLLRDTARGMCSRTVFSGSARRMGGDPSGEVIPDQGMSEETFKCDASGARFIVGPRQES